MHPLHLVSSCLDGDSRAIYRYWMVVGEMGERGPSYRAGEICVSKGHVLPDWSVLCVMLVTLNPYSV